MPFQGVQHNDLILPPFPYWRQYRFIKNGHWVKVRETIDSPARLEHILNTNQASDAYVTIAKWLNPATLGPRGGGYRWASNLFLGSDYVVDCDEGATRTNCEKASRLLAEFFPKQTLISTGRGHHLWIHNFYKNQVDLTPQQNELQCLQAMNTTTDYLLYENVLFDEKISRDTRRVARLWGSTHHNGRRCSLIWSSIKNHGSDNPQWLDENKRVTNWEARANAAWSGSGAATTTLRPDSTSSGD